MAEFRLTAPATLPDFFTATFDGWHVFSFLCIGEDLEVNHYHAPDVRDGGAVVRPALTTYHDLKLLPVSVWSSVLAAASTGVPALTALGTIEAEVSKNARLRVRFYMKRSDRLYWDQAEMANIAISFAGEYAESGDYTIGSGT